MEISHVEEWSNPSYDGITACRIGVLNRLPSLTRAQDPGIQDSMIIGNFDGTPILAGLNTQITVPVYLRTDDSVTFIHVPVATDDDYVHRGTAEYFSLHFLCGMTRLSLLQIPAAPR